MLDLEIVLLGISKYDIEKSCDDNGGGEKEVENGGMTNHAG